MARSFDGSTNRLDWTTPPADISGACTLSFWLYLDSYGGGGLGRVALFQNSAGSEAVDIYCASDSTVFIHYASSGYYRRIASTAMETGGWHHLLITCEADKSSAGAAKIYKDGTELTAGSETTTANAIRATNGTWALGGRIAVDTRNVDGNMSDVGAWNRVLTVKEIAGLKSGLSPLFYKNGLLFAPTLLGYEAEPDPISGLVATHDGTTVVDHPRIYYPSDMFGIYTPAAAHGTVTNIDVQTVIASGSAQAIVPAVATQRNISIDAVIATGSASALAPTLETQRNVGITTPIAESTGQALVPAVETQRNVGINAVIASATGAALAPEISTQRNQSTDAVIAAGSASALQPTVETQSNIEISAEIAQATAQMLVPSISTSSSRDTAIDAVIAAGSASALNPTVETQRNQAVASEIASATAQMPDPTVQTQRNIEIDSAIASATARLLTPSISTSSSHNVEIEAVICSGTSQSLVPSIETQRNIDITAMATGNAAMLSPSVETQRNTEIQAVIATGVGQALVPQINPIILEALRNLRLAVVASGYRSSVISSGYKVDIL